MREPGREANAREPCPPAAPRNPAPLGGPRPGGASQALRRGRPFPELQRRRAGLGGGLAARDTGGARRFLVLRSSGREPHRSPGGASLSRDETRAASSSVTGALGASLSLSTDASLRTDARQPRAAARLVQELLPARRLLAPGKISRAGTPLGRSDLSRRRAAGLRQPPGGTLRARLSAGGSRLGRCARARAGSCG